MVATLPAPSTETHPMPHVTRHLFAQLDQIETEVAGWLAGTDPTSGPITIAEAVKVALVMAHLAGVAEGRSGLAQARQDGYDDGYTEGYDNASDAATEGADYSHADDI